MIKEGKPFQDIFTPRAMVDELLAYCPIKDGDTILDPCTGSGNLIIPILEQHNVQVTAIEIQRQHIDTLIERLEALGIEYKEEKVISVFDMFF